jgi:hypothetical protein
MEVRDERVSGDELKCVEWMESFNCRQSWNPSTKSPNGVPLGSWGTGELANWRTGELTKWQTATSARGEMQIPKQY